MPSPLPNPDGLDYISARYPLHRTATLRPIHWRWWGGRKHILQGSYVTIRPLSMGDSHITNGEEEGDGEKISETTVAARKRRALEDKM